MKDEQIVELLYIFTKGKYSELDVKSFVRDFNRRYRLRGWMKQDVREDHYNYYNELFKIFTKKSGIEIPDIIYSIYADENFYKEFLERRKKNDS